MSSLSSSPILIVDKKGVIGQALARELEAGHIVIFVSSQHLAGKILFQFLLIKRSPEFPIIHFQRFLLFIPESVR